MCGKIRRCSGSDAASDGGVRRRCVGTAARPSRDAPASTVNVAENEGESDEAVRDEPEVDPRLVEAVTREVVKRLSQDLLREIAWEVVPDLAAKIIRERIRELESADPAKKG